MLYFYLANIGCTWILVGSINLDGISYGNWLKSFKKQGGFFKMIRALLKGAELSVPIFLPDPSTTLRTAKRISTPIPNERHKWRTLPTITQINHLEP